MENGQCRMHGLESCVEAKGGDENINESVLQGFGFIKIMASDWIVKRVYMGECTRCCSVSRPRKKWSDSVNEWLQKKRGGGGLDVGQTKRMVRDRNKWQSL